MLKFFKIGCMLSILPQILALPFLKEGVDVVKTRVGEECNTTQLEETFMLIPYKGRGIKSGNQTEIKAITKFNGSNSNF